MATVSILGCGWLGFPLGQFLVSKGFAVKGSTTHQGKLERLKEAGIEPYLLCFKPNLPEDQLDALTIFLQTDILIIAIPPLVNQHGEAYHPEQIRQLLAHLQKSDTPKIIYISSTSVYPDAGEVTEETQQTTIGRSKSALQQAEEILCNLPNKPTILRCGGLMGYDRVPGRYFIGRTDLPTGNVPVNFVHRDDVINIIYEIIKQNKWGELYNVVAPEHPIRKDIYISNAKEFGWAAPSFLEGKTPGFKVVNGSKVIRELNYEYIYPNPLTFKYDMPT